MKTTHLVNRRCLAERQRAANRLNARKSTGPRTERGKRRSSLNALKHGVFARSLKESMQGLGEDPAEFERLRRDFIVSFQPATPFEAALVDDLASLWWRNARAERAEAGLQVKDAERGHIERGRELSDLNRLDVPASKEEIHKVGLMRLPDSQSKFEEAGRFLKMLLARVERGREPVDAEVTIRILYGEKPNWRGQLILSLAKDLRDAEARQARQAADAPPELDPAMPGEEPSEDSAERDGSAALESPEGYAEPDDVCAGGLPDDSDEAYAAEESVEAASSPQVVRALLVNELTAEMIEVDREHALFLERHVEYSGAVYDSHLAPRDSRWPALMRYENDLESRIDRKLKQLERLQSVDGWGGRLRRLNGCVAPRVSGGSCADASPRPIQRPRPSTALVSRAPSPGSRTPAPVPRKMQKRSRQVLHGKGQAPEKEPKTNRQRSPNEATKRPSEAIRSREARPRI
jgi:hypothetical protein